MDSLKARWAAPPSRFVTLQGMQVHVRDEGPRDDPTPIVLIHGTSASLHTWDGWVAALSPHRRVVRMDLPGFGLTGPAPDGDYSMARYTGFMRDFAIHEAFAGEAFDIHLAGIFNHGIADVDADFRRALDDGPHDSILADSARQDTFDARIGTAAGSRGAGESRRFAATPVSGGRRLPDP